MARPRDLETLVAIDHECFPEGVSYDEWELDYFMSLPGAITLVAETDGKTFAFLVTDIRSRGKAATLVTLDVRASKRRAGIGSALLDRSETLLRGNGVASYLLQVDTENTSALSFYTYHGFRIVDRLPDYYANGSDAYLMEKRLEEI
jgi:ribosomal-protein-alanine N-acetyltransferase